MTNTMGRKTLAVLASTTLTAGLLSVGMVTATAAPNVGVNDCGSVETKPKELVLECGDGNEYLDKIKWKKWNKKQATGRATYMVNDCDPTCVDGTWDSYRVKVTLKKPKTQSGERVYSRVILRFPKASPTGKKKMKDTLSRYRPADDNTPMPQESAMPTPSMSPGETAYEDPKQPENENENETPYVTPTPTATPTPSPSTEATDEEQPVAEETVDIAVEDQSRISGRLRVIINAESSVGGDQRGIRAVEVKRFNDVGGALTYDARWAGNYRPTTWTALTGCNSNYRDRMIITVTTNSGKVETYRTEAAPGC